jgi:hypothetical protein
METSPLFNTGLQGLRDALARADSAGSRIASGGASTETSPLFQTGLKGLRDALASADGAGSRIASGGDVTEMTGAIVELQAASQQAEASAKLLEVGGRTIGTLIDVMA